MLTATEIVFIKDLIEDLVSICNPAEYTRGEVNTAMELLNRIEPIETDKVLDLIDSINEEEEYYNE